MSKIIYFFSLIWLIAISKYLLFWLYLWQLKEYHIGRFLDYFRTNKGKKTLLNPLQLFKIFLLILSLRENFLNFVLWTLIGIYFAQILGFLKNFLSKKIKAPTFTFKAFFLSIISFSFLIFLLLLNLLNVNETKLVRNLLIIDIFLIFIVSGIVILIQPFVVLIRKVILNKAKLRLEKIKSLTSLKVIAITGSYGKTSTKEFLATILSQKYKVLATEKHQNSEIAIAKLILNKLKIEHQILIAEIGAYNKGKVKEVCNMLKPDIGIVTGINEQHLALFGNMKNLLSAEGGEELSESLNKTGGILIVNGNNKYCLELLKKNKIPSEKERIYTLERNRVEADIFAEEIIVEKDCLAFLIMDKEKNLVNFKVNILGKHNIQNLLAAILAAKELGLTLEKISQASKKIQPEQGGIILRKGKKGIYIIDSSYSSNPDGVIADSEYLSLFPNKKVIIMPCLIELGKASSEIHKKIGKKIGEVCQLAIITTKDKFLNIKEGALESGLEEKNIILCDNPEKIFLIITTFCKEGDAVLLEGRVPYGLTKLLSEENELF